MTSERLTFDGRVAVVTGAGRGLGLAYATQLAVRGAAVVVNDPGVDLNGTGGDTSVAEQAVAEIVARGGTAVADASDIATDAGAAAVVDRALSTYGRIDVLINNAGIVDDAAFHKIDVQRADRVLAVHLGGSLRVTAAAWPHMREREYGRIVMTTSTSGLYGNFGQAAYAAAKSGIVGLTRVLAIEGKRRNILVNAVAPGAVTRITPAELNLTSDALPADAVAPVVLYLAHEYCEVSGEVYRASGGHVARVFIAQATGQRSRDITPEFVRDEMSAIRDLTEFTVPISAVDPGSRA
jgi:NAD(P)-dependent dehydrogenase (short-subunit alcohol dehydrogenase family)